MNGFGQMKDGRGNIAPVTIILPTIAMESKEAVDNDFALKPYSYKNELYVDEFIDRLEQAIDDARDILIERYQYMA